jgi:hypothetical protein
MSKLLFSCPNEFFFKEGLATMYSFPIFFDWCAQDVGWGKFIVIVYSLSHFSARAHSMLGEKSIVIVYVKITMNIKVKKQPHAKIIGDVSPFRIKE